MAKLQMLIELNYDDGMMHGNEPEAVNWFETDILLGDDGQLILYSNGIGDTLGSVKVLQLRPSAQQDASSSALGAGQTSNQNNQGAG